jgi:cytochrome c-type biogenesis protein CcmH
VQACALALAMVLSLGASGSSARYNDLGHRMMCTCGCAQLLGECNHVGCTVSDKARAELAAMIASGRTDAEILDAFQAKYGATVLAAPPMRGFDLVAWIAPIAVFLAAALGTILLVRRWASKQARAEASGATARAAADLDPAFRQQQEKIRRETGGDGGFQS